MLEAASVIESLLNVVTTRGLHYKTFYGRRLTDLRNKVEYLSLASLSTLV